MIRRPPRSTPKPSSAASDVYKRQLLCTKVRSKALVYYPVLKLAYNYCLLCTKMPKSPIKILFTASAQ